jgi:hypothetical protein
VGIRFRSRTVVLTAGTLPLDMLEREVWADLTTSTAR